MENISTNGLPMLDCQAAAADPADPAATPPTPNPSSGNEIAPTTAPPIVQPIL